MKKLILLTIMTVASAATIFAQEDNTTSSFPEKGDKEFSVHVGYNSSSFINDNDDMSESANGLYAGFRADFYWGNKWSFTTGAYYDQKGSGLIGSEEFEVDYISVPLNINWHFGKNRRWNLNFGPNVAFLLSAEAAGTDLKNNFKSVDPGFDLGIGHKIPVGNNYIQLALNGTTGISDISSADNSSSVRNTRSNFSIGFIF